MFHVFAPGYTTPRNPKPSPTLLDLEKFRSLPFHIGAGTWKNAELSLYILLHPRFWDLEKFRALPSYSLWDFKKIPKSAFM